MFAGAEAFWGNKAWLHFEHVSEVFFTDRVGVMVALRQDKMRFFTYQT